MKLTIGRRMAVLTMVMTLAILANAGFGLWAKQRSHRLATEFIDQEFATRQVIGELHVALLQARHHEKDLLIGMNNESTVERESKAWQTQRARAMTLLDNLTGRVQGDEAKQSTAELGKRIDAYMKSFELVASRVKEGAFDNASAASKLMLRVNSDFKQAEDILLAANEALSKRSAALREQFSREGAVALWLFGGIALAAVLVALVSGWRATRAIVSPLRDAVQVAKSVAAGDLTAARPPTRHDEIGELQVALIDMTRQLQRLIGEVRAASARIGTASGEIALGNSDLSSRTEQQAASLQQTTSSMQQLTDTVGTNAQSAQQADTLAQSASEVAQRGGAVVEQVVSTMQEIADSSKRIADIIGVIDGIAFQTNILALNAAVEAARAGEQGRGFAVVAGEVRSLAKQSADAARQIKTLIGASVARVESGSRLVVDAGSTMREIVVSVQRVTDIIGEISAATGGQTSEIGQVNAAMGSLDEMTQQNAALVEQSTAAAESLKEQAARLAAAIDAFHLDTRPH